MIEASTLNERLETLRGKLDAFADMVHVEEKAEELTELENQMSAPGFWEDQNMAQSVIQRVKTLKGLVDPYRELSEGVTACRELVEMSADDADSMAELDEEIGRMEASYDSLEVQLALSGPYDGHNVYLSIQPGAGGTESCDWGAMLLRMYSNYCQKAGYDCELLEYQDGEEAGIKAATLHVRGANAYGYLKSEMGTHRLVRMSPFNAQGKRQTSFCAVEVTPEIEEEGDVKMENLDDKEFRIDTYRASGAGGQHVNKTDSAVRITHIPTNTVASCQTERSQQQNRQKAWKMMTAKLQQLQDAERLEELQALQGERGTIGWGHQIRSYVLQPTQLITDLRTRLKEGNAQKVLDGDLQPFIDSYLRWRLQEQGT